MTDKTLCELFEGLGHDVCPPAIRNALARRALDCRVQVEDLVNMVVAQRFRCAICNTELHFDGRGSAAVDHDHNTSIVRGIICVPCNLMVGRIEKAPVPLERYLDYIKSPPFKLQGNHRRTK